MVLKEIAQCIAGLAREHDIVARIGGEEFAIIAPYANQRDLESIGQRYRATIEKLTLKIDNIRLKTTVSIGVSGNRNAATANEMFKAADRHLYEAKRNGPQPGQCRPSGNRPQAGTVIPCPGTGS